MDYKYCPAFDAIGNKQGFLSWRLVSCSFVFSANSYSDLLASDWSMKLKFQEWVGAALEVFRMVFLEFHIDFHSFHGFSCKST